jgi:hypothetical protein
MTVLRVLVWVFAGLWIVMLTGAPEIEPTDLWPPVLCIIWYVVYVVAVAIRRGRTMWPETVAVGIGTFPAGIMVSVFALAWGGGRWVWRQVHGSRDGHAADA